MVLLYCYLTGLKTFFEFLYAIVKLIVNSIEVLSNFTYLSLMLLLFLEEVAFLDVQFIE